MSKFIANTIYKEKMEKYIQENLIKDGQEKLNNKELKIV